MLYIEEVMPNNIAYIRDARILFLVYIINISVCLVFIYSRFQGFKESQDWVSHTLRVQKYLQTSYSDLKEAESAQRGFLLTDDSSFLTPFHQARTKAIQSLDNVQDMLTDKKQEDNLAELKQLTERRFYLLNETLENKKFFSEDLALKKEHLVRGMAEMDSLKECIENMLSLETKLLHKREHSKDVYEQTTLKYALALILFSLAIITFSYFWVARELRKSANREDQSLI